MAAGNHHSKTVYVIAGPTAVGKTAIAIALAQNLNTSIISADSRQCYREMSIGTARPSAEELATVPHYFINSHAVEEEISAAGFERLALGYLDEIFSKANTAVVCGGTGLYIRALCEGLDDMPATDPAIAAEVQKGFDEEGTAWLQQCVATEDPLFFAEGEIENPARLMRALVFVRSTGKSITSFRSRKKKSRPFNLVKIGLELPREELYQRINQRVDLMMNAGLLEEVRALQSRQHLKALQTVGYSELFNFLNGECTLPQAIDKIKQHSRNYAKRQLTWFKRDAEFTWYQPDTPDIIQLLQSSEP